MKLCLLMFLLPDIIMYTLSRYFLWELVMQTIVKHFNKAFPCRLYCHISVVSIPYCGHTFSATTSLREQHTLSDGSVRQTRITFRASEHALKEEHQWSRNGGFSQRAKTNWLCKDTGIYRPTWADVLLWATASVSQKDTAATGSGPRVHKQGTTDI